MKRIQHILFLSLMFLLTACGEDRSDEFYALIEDRMWIEEVMREKYLWYDQLPEKKDDDYFTSVESFFKSLLYKGALDGKGDNYSYVEMLDTEEARARAMTLNRTSTYGMEFELLSDPLKKSTRTYARILYVLPDSPADKAGIKRGDWISAIDNQKLNNKNYVQMMTGGNLALSREAIVTAEDGKRTWQVVDTVSVSPSVNMEISPFFIDSIYETNGQRIAYFMYNEFATGPNNNASDFSYDEQMYAIFANIKRQNPDAFILDLRYNPGGYLSCAQTLGSLLAPADKLGETFTKLQFNDKSSPQSMDYPLLPEYADANLNLGKIYILTTRYTASASEAIINGLIPLMGKENVVLIGEKTEGKNVAMTAYQDERFNFILWPVTAFVANGNGEGDYSTGFLPQYELDERSMLEPWYPLGDTQEYYLKNTLSLITEGRLSDEPGAPEEEVQSILSTITTRTPDGCKINYPY